MKMMKFHAIFVTDLLLLFGLFELGMCMSLVSLSWVCAYELRFALSAVQQHNIEKAKVMVHKSFPYAPCIRTSQLLDLLDTCNNSSLLSSHPTIKLHFVSLTISLTKTQPATPSSLASKTVPARWLVVHHRTGVSKQLRIQFFSIFKYPFSCRLQIRP